MEAAPGATSACWRPVPPIMARHILWPDFYGRLARLAWRLCCSASHKALQGAVALGKKGAIMGQRPNGDQIGNLFFCKRASNSSDTCRAQALPVHPHRPGLHFCMDMCGDRRIDMCIIVCIDTCVYRRAYRHVHRHVHSVHRCMYRYAHRHVYRHVGIDLCADVSIYICIDMCIDMCIDIYMDMCTEIRTYMCL